MRLYLDSRNDDALEDLLEEPYRPAGSIADFGLRLPLLDQGEHRVHPEG